MKLRSLFRRRKQPKAKPPEINWQRAANALIEEYKNVLNENDRLRAEINRLRAERKERQCSETRSENS